MKIKIPQYLKLLTQNIEGTSLTAASNNTSFDLSTTDIPEIIKISPLPKNFKEWHKFKKQQQK